jgi:hypothetical protein
MKTARDLMLAYLAGTAEESGALFADNGTRELPYLASNGLSPVLTGPAEITKFLTFLHESLYPGHTPEQVFAEYQINHGPAFQAKTSSSNSSVTWRPTAARSRDSGRRSTWWLPRKLSIRTPSPTFLQRGHRPNSAAVWAGRWRSRGRCFAKSLDPHPSLNRSPTAELADGLSCGDCYPYVHECSPFASALPFVADLRPLRFQSTSNTL